MSSLFQSDRAPTLEHFDYGLQLSKVLSQDFSIGGSRNDRVLGKYIKTLQNPNPNPLLHLQNFILYTGNRSSNLYEILGNTVNTEIESDYDVSFKTIDTDFLRRVSNRVLLRIIPQKSTPVSHSGDREKLVEELVTKSDKPRRDRKTPMQNLVKELENKIDIVMEKMNKIVSPTIIEGHKVESESVACMQPKQKQQQKEKQQKDDEDDDRSSQQSESSPALHPLLAKIQQNLLGDAEPYRRSPQSRQPVSTKKRAPTSQSTTPSAPISKRNIGNYYYQCLNADLGGFSRGGNFDFHYDDYDSGEECAKGSGPNSFGNCGRSVDVADIRKVRRDPVPSPCDVAAKKSAPHSELNECVETTPQCSKMRKPRSKNK
jgi:hypothetical protein